MHLLIESIINGITTGSVFALLGVTFGLIYYMTKVFHLAFGSIGTAGTYVAVAVSGSSASFGALLGGSVLGVLLDAALTLVIVVLIYEPLSRRGANSGMTFVASLGLALLIEAGVELVFGAGNRQFSVTAFTNNRSVLGYGVSYFNGVELVLMVVVVAALAYILNRTRIGFHVRAIASSREQAQLLGIRTGIIVGGACAVLGGISAIAFILYGMSGSVIATSGEQLTLYAVLAALAGGVASPIRTAAAGVVIGIVNSVGGAYIPGQWAIVLVFVVAVIVILARPRSSGTTTPAGAPA
jgi:branched-chain amino acid transport system permease protein